MQQNSFIVLEERYTSSDYEHMYGYHMTYLFFAKLHTHDLHKYSLSSTGLTHK